MNFPNTSTPPPTNHASNYPMPSLPHLPSPASTSSRHGRGSIGSSFSFGPQQLVDRSGYSEANSSTLSQPYSFALDPNRSLLDSSPMRSSPRARRRKPVAPPSSVFKSRTRDGEGSRHPLANDTTTDIFGDSDGDADNEDEDEERTIVDRMREWRTDALVAHMYKTAAHWGDKLLTLTNDQNDAFWLAQIYFWSNQFARAERLLTRPFSLLPPVSARIPGDDIDLGLPVNGISKVQSEPKPLTPYISRLPMGAGGLIEVPEELQETTSRLVDMSLSCRYLCAQCQMQQGHWDNALEMLGESNAFADSGSCCIAISIHYSRVTSTSNNGIKVEALMCHLRGMLMLKLNRGERAKECFMEALVLDAKCFDSFEMLVSNEMMTVEEEWNFVQGLAYAAHTPDDAGFVQLIYTTRLRKNSHVEEQKATLQKLIKDFGMGDNPDVLTSAADTLYNQSQWEQCYTLTTRILQMTMMHDGALPLHIACMFHLKALHPKLFILAHELVDKEPGNPLSWYAVGVWYLCTKKWGAARQYFSKTSLMDPRFAPAWIAFGHTFALEGEHEHAVVSYSSCARMFPASHLPLTFVGMEHLMLAHHGLAEEALNAANTMCDSDPLLMNERGAMAFWQNDFQQAAELFQKALDTAKVTTASSGTWATTFLNLGTALRKLGRYEESKRSYDQVLLVDPKNVQALVHMGIVNHLMGNIADSILCYHEALAIEPINPHAVELLSLAMESSALVGVGNAQQEEWFGCLAKLGEKWKKLGMGMAEGVVGEGGKGAGEDKLVGTVWFNGMNVSL
ncbi:cell division control protein 16 [Flagelloscypha sp. PMI_526]|nr:cell division control protein 16 [Flagelloscypha sp. PMI_526]